MSYHIQVSFARDENQFYAIPRIYQVETIDGKLVYTDIAELDDYVNPTILGLMGHVFCQVVDDINRLARDRGIEYQFTQFDIEVFNFNLEY